MRAAFRSGCALVAVAALSASCGVPRDGHDRPLRRSQVAFDPIPGATTTTRVAAGVTTTALEPSTTVAPTTTTTNPSLSYPFALYWIRGDQVVRVRRQLPLEPTLALVSAIFLQGPDPLELDTGLRTALPLPSSIIRVTSEAGTATVELDASFFSLGGQEQIRGIAQIVYTVTGVAGVGRVRFAFRGRAVAVPRADGQPTSVPVSRDDYRSLVATDSDVSGVPTTYVSPGLPPGP